MLHIRILSLLTFLIVSTIVSAQEDNSFKVEHFTLENGLKVYLNQDATASNVFGGVLVKVGSIHESPDATGLSHYLEHMLFKGNQNLGTTDFESEKVHYQRIISLYGELENTTGGKRKKLQEEINKESIAAAKYGLPNEFSALMKSIGSTQVSAFADYDVTFYHSYFPGVNIEHWLDINAERFVNPVFRTFQSELEVVYEEKNRWDDDYENALYIASLETAFGDYAYGRWPTIGKTEHLKNPSLTKMHEFYDKHYVSDNMVLVLTGNFELDRAKAAIENSFSRLKSTGYQPTKFAPYEPMIGERKKEISVSPVPVIGLLYPIESLHHENRPAIDLAMYLLSNDQKTGLLDKLETEGKIQKLYAEVDDYALASLFNIYAVPNDQSSAEETKSLIRNEIKKLKEPAFFSDALEGARRNLIKNFWLDLENLETRALYIASCDYTGTTWEKALSYPSLLESVSDELVASTISQYFGENYGLLVSKKGKPKKDNVEKPKIDPVPTLQASSSAYGKALLGKLSQQSSNPLTIDFTLPDAFSIGSNEGLLIKNTINDLFTLEIRIQKGWRSDPSLQQTVDLLAYVGTQSQSNADIKSRFESLGSGFEISLEADELVIALDGLDSELQSTLKLLNELLNDPKVTPDAIDALYTAEKIKREEERSSPFLAGYSLIRHGVFDSQTKFLTRTPIETIKQTETSVYERRIKQLLTNEVHVNYFGSKPKDGIKELFQTVLPLSPNAPDVSSKEPVLREIPENNIFLINDAKSRQSQVYFYLKGSPFESHHYPYMEAFNTYFGESLTGVVYQEIREYRSLAYSIFGRYITPYNLGEEGYLVAGFGCQSDKTDEAINVMIDIIKEFPSRPGRIETLRSTKMEEMITTYPSLRQLGTRIHELKRKGYTKDPNENAFAVYKELQLEDLAEFYNSQFKDQPFILTIYGNKSDIDMEKLRSMGQVVELKMSDIFTN